VSRTVVVTGGKRGIGTAITAAFAAENVVPLSSSDLDVTDEDAVTRFFAQLGPVDVLVNNAGITADAPFAMMPPEDFTAVIDTNLTGIFVCTQEAIKIMKAQTPKGGRIINNGSISAHTPRPRAAAYTATKHAVTGLTKQTALDCRNDMILCSQIDIGNAATPLTDRMVQGAGVLQPDGSMAIEARMNADDVGRAVVYIANLPLDTNVLFMTVMANGMPFVGRG